jgi:ribosomal protein S18 acetylase RimI-like enzyme
MDAATISRKMPEPSVQNPLPVTIRTYRPEDQAQVRKLYLEGLVGGKIASNDTGLDIDDVPSAYLLSPDNHFWVAVNQKGEVVGNIGVQQCEDGVAEIRRLRVRQDSRRRGVGSALMETAVKFCRERNFLKITLDTFTERDPAIRLFEKFHFNHSRTRQVGEKELLYFYLDLYQGERTKHR